jgi:hypothetical protein
LTAVRPNGHLITGQALLLSIQQCLTNIIV